jgi:hypothetical protein
MGSGSGGGGGGGSGGATASGGKGYGGYKIVGDRLIVQDVDAEEKAEAVRGVLTKLRPEYLHEMFVDSSAREVYRELSLLNVDLCMNRSWTGIADRLGVDGGPGCLTRLIAALMRRLKAADRNKKSRAFVRMALENFLLRAMRDDSNRLVSATAKDAIGDIDADVFEHLAGLFLGDLLYEVVRGEERALPPEVKTSLRPVVQARADKVVSDFGTRFRGKSLDTIKQVSYRNLFDVIASQEDWFLEALRKDWSSDRLSR